LSRRNASCRFVNVIDLIIFFDTSNCSVLNGFRLVDDEL
jgi:hypothetical protein